MNLQQIYELALDMGMKADPRGIEKVKKQLARAEKEYKELPEKKKKFFDKETITNPYADTRVLFGDSKTEVKKVLAGIDADSSEVLLVDRLNEKGQHIDLLISHHPNGHALAGLYEVMEMQAEIAAVNGVPLNVAYSLIQERMSKVQRGFRPINHGQAVDAARLLNVPLLAIHTVWDNLGNKEVWGWIDKKKASLFTLGDLHEYLLEIPEYAQAITTKVTPIIVSGSSKTPLGKIAFGGFTGGTNPSKEFYIEMAKAGVGTIIDMHLHEDVIDEMKKRHINVIDMGHMPSDSIGANIFLDELEKKGVEVIPGAGLIRVKRI